MVQISIFAGMVNGELKMPAHAAKTMVAGSGSARQAGPQQGGVKPPHSKGEKRQMNPNATLANRV
jgi:hypothetical protein